MADQNAPIPNISMSWLTLVIIIIVGIFALFNLWMGFQAFGSDNSEQSLIYLLVGTIGFAVIGYMFFRTKPMTSKEPEIPKAEVVTILECPSCELKRVRDFKRGDYINKDDEPCTRCDGNMVVSGIHKKVEPKQKPRR